MCPCGPASDARCAAVQHGTATKRTCASAPASTPRHSFASRFAMRPDRALRPSMAASSLLAMLCANVSACTPSNQCILR